MAEGCPVSYNREVRIIWAVGLVLCLAACNRGNGSQEAVRQGVIDFVAARGLNIQGMNVDLTSVQFNGNQADATVEFTPKGGPAGSGMSMKYQLQQQSGKWVVTGRKDAGPPHGAGGQPSGQAPMENPHGGGMGAPPAGGGSAMPSPQDLPPVKKNK
jgi:hypothetical protein